MIQKTVVLRNLKYVFLKVKKEKNWHHKSDHISDKNTLVRTKYELLSVGKSVCGAFDQMIVIYHTMQVCLILLDTALNLTRSFSSKKPIRWNMISSGNSSN